MGAGTYVQDRNIDRHPFVVKLADRGRVALGDDPGFLAVAAGRVTYEPGPRAHGSARGAGARGHD